MNSNNYTGYMLQWLNDTYNTGGNTRIIQTLYDNMGNIVKTYENTMNTIDFDYHYRTILTKRTISRQLVPTTEERLEGYIQDNYDRYTVHEYGSYIYQMIQE